MWTDNKYILANNAVARLGGPISDTTTHIPLVDSSQALIDALNEVTTATWSGMERKTRAFLTICNDDETEHEIVEVVSFDEGTQTVSVERGQDDTDAQSWPADSKAEMRACAGLLANLTAGKGQYSIALGSNYGDAGDSAIGIGHLASAGGRDEISIGRGAGSIGPFARAISIGRSANASERSVAVGHWASGGAESNDANAVAIGSDAYVEGEGAIAVGSGAFALSNRAVIVGNGAGCGMNSNYGIAIGSQARTSINHGAHIAAIPYLPAAYRLPTVESIDIKTRHRSVAITGLATDILQLTDDTDFYDIEIPGNAHFFPKQIEILITGVDGAGGNPEIQIGTSEEDAESILTSTTVTVSEAYQMQAVQADSSNGVDNIRVSVATAGTGVAYNCRVIVSGYLVEDE